MAYKYKLGNKSGIRSVETTEGETIEKKIERIVNNKEPIKDGAPEIYTERKDGVIAGYNIRTDRWEIAAEAMDVIERNIAAKREHKAEMKVVKDEKKIEKTIKDKQEIKSVEDTSTPGKQGAE